MPIDPRTFPLDDVRDYLEQTFRHVAEQKGLAFDVQMDRAPAGDDLQRRRTRLQQILKNLLSNAFKFTAKGGVTHDRCEPTRATTTRSIRFSVQDTGIGIPLDKQKLIFEAFQQADGTTSRKYGGTGLGLTISREIARLLGGVDRRRERAGTGQHVHAAPARRATPAPRRVAREDAPHARDGARAARPAAPGRRRLRRA